MDKFIKLLKNNIGFILAIIFVLLLRTYVLSPFQVDGISMYPTFEDGQRIEAIKFFNPKRSDIVIIDSPVVPDKQYIKRIIGLPGDRVSIAGGQLIINGEQVEENYINNQIDLPEVVVGQNHYLVLGDNRQHSLDGSEFGTIPKEKIKAKVLFTYWPFKDMKWFN